MNDIYLTSYTSREKNIHSELTRLARVSSSSPSNSTSVDGHSTTEQTDESSAAAASIIAIRTTASSLLGGSFRALVDCRRFVLTSVVVERHGKHMLEVGIIERLVRSLQQLILKLLKVFASICYGYDDGQKNEVRPDSPAATGGGGSSHSIRDSAVAMLKKAYRKLHDDSALFTSAMTRINAVITSDEVDNPSKCKVESDIDTNTAQPSHNSIMLAMVASICDVVDEMNSSDWLREML
jgi:hypothetical protein